MKPSETKDENMQRADTQSPLRCSSQGVQSLILSPLIHDMFPPRASDFQTGLFLEDSSVSDSVETRDETECETLSCMSVSILHLPEGSCNRMFCGCDVWAQPDSVFASVSLTEIARRADERPVSTM